MNEMRWFSRINSNHVEVKFELLSWQKKSDTSHSYFYSCIYVYFCYWIVSYTSYSLPQQALWRPHTCPSACSSGRGSPLTAVLVSVSRWPHSPALQPYFGFSVHNCFTNRETLQSVAGHYMQTHAQIIDPLPSKLQKCLSDL